MRTNVQHLSVPSIRKLVLVCHQKVWHKYRILVGGHLLLRQRTGEVRRFSLPRSADSTGNRLNAEATSCIHSRNTSFQNVAREVSEQSLSATSVVSVATRTVTPATGGSTGILTFTDGRSTASRRCSNTRAKSVALRSFGNPSAIPQRRVRRAERRTATSASNAGCTSVMTVERSPMPMLMGPRISDEKYLRVPNEIGVPAGWHSQRFICSTVVRGFRPARTGRGPRTLISQRGTGNPGVDGACAVCVRDLRSLSVHAEEDVIPSPTGEHQLPWNFRSLFSRDIAYTHAQISAA